MVRGWARRVMTPVGVAALAAGVLVAGPRLTAAIGPAATSCLGPASPGVVSIGAGLDAGVVALTARLGAAGQVPVGVQMIDVPAADASTAGLWVSGPGSPPSELRRDAAGCWTGTVPRSALAELRVRGAAPVSPVLATFALPAQAASAAALLGRARAHTLASAGVRDVTLARGSTTSPWERVISDFSGTSVTSRGPYGAQTQSWPGWRTGFAWVAPGIEASVVLGMTALDGRPVEQVAGAVAGAPMWMRLDIDPVSGAVLWDSMNGPHHVMTDQLTGA